MTLWDPEVSRTILAATHDQNVDFNVYEGMTINRLARTTNSQGRVVWHDGDLWVVRGAGRYVERACFSVSWILMFTWAEIEVESATKQFLRRFR